MQTIILQPDNELNSFDTDVYNYTKTYVHETLPDIETVTKTAQSDNSDCAVISYISDDLPVMRHVQYNNSTIATLLYDGLYISKVIVSAFDLVIPITENPQEQSDTQLSYLIKSIPNPAYSPMSNSKTVRVTSVIYTTYDSKYQLIVEYGCWLNDCRSVCVHIADGYRVFYNDFQDPSECECLKNVNGATFSGGFGLPGYIV